MATHGELLQASRAVRAAHAEKVKAERTRNNLIRDAYTEGMSTRQIATSTGMAVNHVQKVLGQEHDTPVDP